MTLGSITRKHVTIVVDSDVEEELHKAKGESAAGTN